MRERQTDSERQTEMVCAVEEGEEKDRESEKELEQNACIKKEGRKETGAER